MRSFNRIWTAAILGTALTAVTNAQTINQRRENQQDRIAQGINSGSLSAGQAARLETKEARLNREIRDDREDHNGHLTKAGRAQINRQQNKLSRQIYRAKHK
jgi:metal-dependent amidase/aminoacylase/carboxypeptidase family protein